ncbi:MAG TPA: DUF2851 family protein, partial [Chitinophagaceae bacterium]|nr:DUF2851 family protein [Chitinophagaceae bacterium]
NTNQGPDFLNAKIKIENTFLAGSVELHLHTSDWERHKHGDDANYNNVVLHVVFQHDETISSSLPVLELQSRISNLLLQKYRQFMEQPVFIPCSRCIVEAKDITWIAWKERLLVERLTRKSERIFQFLKENNYHWEETFWWLLSRNFGGKINGDAFEELARSVSINILAKHKSQIQQIEALLFGQANLLSNKYYDNYAQLLQREYRFLAGKFNLQPIHANVHFLRMRPANFPTIRIAQLSALVHQSNHLFSKIIETENINEVKSWLQVTANDYWHYHYLFDEETDYKPKKLGSDMADSILINTIIPLLFTYGQYHRDEKFKSRSLKWLDQIKAEKNSIISGFQNLNITSNSAFDSQSLIELKNEYCNFKRCLECSVGSSLLKNY